MQDLQAQSVWPSRNSSEAMEQDHRVGAYLLPDEKKDFDRYAKQFHIRPATLVSLLVVRELRRKRLRKLSSTFSSMEAGRARVTGQRDLPLKKAFEKHADKAGLKPDPAATILLRAELSERWLKAAMIARIVESG